MKQVGSALLLGALAPWAIACGSDDGGGSTLSLDEQAAPVVAGYGNIVHASYVASLDTAKSLDQALQALVDGPESGTLEAARQAWLVAREPYGQTEVYRFYGGPIDDDDGPEGELNAWPMDESYVDYIETNPDAGVINDPSSYATIDVRLIASLNEQGGETNISTGYHAVEFLLWGQDMNANGLGQRPAIDYVTDGMGIAKN